MFFPVKNIHWFFLEIKKRHLKGKINSSASDISENCPGNQGCLSGIRMIQF